MNIKLGKMEKKHAKQNGCLWRLLARALRDGFLAILFAIISLYIYWAFRPASYTVWFQPFKEIHLYIVFAVAFLLIFVGGFLCGLYGNIIVQQLMAVYRFPDLARCFLQIFEAASANDAECNLDLRNAISLLRNISLRLHPENAKDCSEETTLFNKAIERFGGFPESMRFTDLRGPQEWEVGSQLQRYTMVVARSLLDRPQDRAWFFHRGGLIHIKLTHRLKRAVQQCLQNYHDCCLDEPIGHARRWIGCKSWHPDHKKRDQDEQLIANLLFDRLEDPREGAKKFSTAIRSGKLRSPCTKCPDINGCHAIDPTKLSSVINDTTHLNLRSAYDSCDIQHLKVYWPDGYANRLISGLKPRMKIVDPEDKEKPEAILDCFRVLFWKREVFESKWTSDLLRLWDNVLNVPTFWVDPEDGIAATDRNNEIHKYFVANGHDYLFLQANSLGPLAFKTKVEEGKLPKSIELTKAAEIDELGSYFNALLDILGEGDPKSPEKMLLACHAAKIID